MIKIAKLTELSHTLYDLYVFYVRPLVNIKS